MRYATPVSNTAACVTLDAVCSVCGVHCGILRRSFALMALGALTVGLLPRFPRDLMLFGGDSAQPLGLVERLAYVHRHDAPSQERAGTIPR